MFNAVAPLPSMQASAAAPMPTPSHASIGNLPVHSVASSPEKPDIRDRHAQPDIPRRGKDKARDAAEGFSLHIDGITGGPSMSVSAFHAQLLAQSDAAEAHQWIAWHEPA